MQRLEALCRELGIPCLAMLGPILQRVAVAQQDIDWQRFNSLFWDPNLSRADKVDKIVNELMAPHNIDGLVGGQFKQNSDGSATLRPFVISRAAKIVFTESRTFNKGEFGCPEPGNAQKTILCEKAAADIRETILRLLIQL